MSTDSLRYAGFGARLGANLMDMIIMIPLIALHFWGNSQSRLYEAYMFVPNFLFMLFYNVYLVQRYGGTPGKLIVGIRIRKLDGQAVGYREAFLRNLPTFILGAFVSLALIIPLFQITDVEYHSLGMGERIRRLTELAPFWHQPLQWTQTAWTWGELVVLLTNHKRRALHDFIAGTVVVHVQPLQTPTPTADATA